MNVGKCPYCGNVINTVRTERIAVGGEFIAPDSRREEWPGISYICPNPTCGSVLGVSVDPVLIASKIKEHTQNVIAPIAQQIEDLRKRVQKA